MKAIEGGKYIGSHELLIFFGALVCSEISWLNQIPMKDEDESVEGQAEGAIVLSLQEIQALMDDICLKERLQHRALEINMVLGKFELFFEGSSSCGLLHLPNELVFKLIVFYILAFETRESFEQSFFAQKYNIENFVVSNAEMFYLSYDFEAFLSCFSNYLQKGTKQRVFNNEKCTQAISNLENRWGSTREKYIYFLVSISPYCIVDDLVYNSLYFQGSESSGSQVVRCRELHRFSGVVPLWENPGVVFEWLLYLVRFKCFHRDVLKHLLDNALYFDALNSPIRFLLLSEIIKSYAELDKISRHTQLKKEIKESLSTLEDSRSMIEAYNRLDTNIAKSFEEVNSVAERESDGNEDMRISGDSTVEGLEISLKNRISLLEGQLVSFNSETLEKYQNPALQNYFEGRADVHNDNVFVLVSNIWDELLSYLGIISQRNSTELEKSIIDLLVVMLNLTGDFLRLRVAESQTFLFKTKLDKCKFIYAIACNFKDIELFSESIQKGFHNCQRLPECDSIKESVIKRQSSENDCPAE